VVAFLSRDVISLSWGGDNTWWMQLDALSNLRKKITAKFVTPIWKTRELSILQRHPVWHRWWLPALPVPSAADDFDRLKRHPITHTSPRNRSFTVTESRPRPRNNLLSTYMYVILNLPLGSSATGCWRRTSLFYCLFYLFYFIRRRPQRLYWMVLLERLINVLTYLLTYLLFHHWQDVVCTKLRLFRSRL